MKLGDHSSGTSEVLRLLERLVEFETVNDPAKGVKPTRECAEFIQDYLAQAGVKADILESNGYYTVYGRLGAGKPKLLMMAHWDTVPADPDEWTFDPFKVTVSDGRVYGRGVADDKGNTAAMLLSIRELAKLGVEGIAFAFTGDEEVGGRHGAGLIASLMKRSGTMPRYLVNGDGVGERIIVRRRNAFSVKIHVPVAVSRIRGSLVSKRFESRTPVIETRHAAYFMPGVDTHAVISASHWVRSVGVKVIDIKGGFLKGNVVPGWAEVKGVDPGEGEEYEVDDGLTMLLSAVIPLVRAPIPVEGYSDYGVSITPNIIRKAGDHWVLHLDIRAMSGSLDSVCNAMKEVASRSLKGARVKCSGGAGYFNTPEDSAVVKAALGAAEALGMRVSIGEGAGASDSRYFGPEGVQAIDFGPLGGNIHGPDEWASVESLIRLPEFYTLIASELIRG